MISKKNGSNSILNLQFFPLKAHQIASDEQVCPDFEKPAVLVRSQMKRERVLDLRFSLETSRNIS